MKIRNILNWLFLLIAGLSLVGMCNVMAASNSEATTVVTMTNQDQFSPREIRVIPGTIVKWTNADTDAHTVTVESTNAIAGGPSSDSSFPVGLSSGQSYGWTVPVNAVAGTTWFYHCRFHGQSGTGQALGSGMTGSIKVSQISYSGTFPASTPRDNNGSGLTQATLTLNTLNREVLVYRPGQQSALPLLILLSPTGSDLWSNIADDFGRGDLTDFADREQVVLALPMQRTLTYGDWDNHSAGSLYYETASNDGSPDNQINAPVSSNPDINSDLLLVRAVIQEAQRAYGVDTSRVYVNGFSNGAFFSYFVAAVLNNQIAAFAETGGGLVLSGTTYGDPTPCTLSPTPGTPGEVRSCASSGWIASSCVSTGAIHRPIATASVSRVPPGFLQANDDDNVVPFAHTCNLANHLSGEKTARIVHTGGGHSITADYLGNSWNFLKTHRLDNSSVVTLITLYYQTILGRAPEPSGLAYYQDKIAKAQAQGDVKPAFRQMGSDFFNSPEYLNRNTSNTDYIANLYKTFLQRNPDAGGLQFYLDRLAKGESRNTFITDFTNSPEFANFMNNLGF